MSPKPHSESYIRKALSSFKDRKSFKIYFNYIVHANLIFYSAGHRVRARPRTLSKISRNLLTIKG